MNRQEYEAEFERWVGGSKARKRALRAELTEHLDAAQAAGELDQAMQRLGSPHHAAKTFAEGSDLQIARVGRRIAAALLDAGVFVALIFGGLASGTWSATREGAFRDRWDLEAMTALGITLIIGAVFWWLILLPILEWRAGRTFGKAVMGLRVVAEDGTAPSFGQIVLRRLTLVFSGPLQVIDWGFMFFTPKRQRAFDILAHTLVVDEREDVRGQLQTAVTSAL